VWERLVRLTDGLYPAEMAFGPEDIGHWKDKLPYVRHDLELVKERAELLDKFGRFDFGFDFGAPVKTPANLASFLPEDPASYRARAFVLANTLAPRFLLVDPDMRYADSRGYGWTSDGRRAAEAIPLTPYLEIRAVAKNPANLPHDVLYRDYIRGRERKFPVRVENVWRSRAEAAPQFAEPDRVWRIRVNPDFSSPGIDTSVDAANTSVCATPVVNSLFARNRGARSQRAVPALLPACLDRELMRNPG